MRVPPPLGGTPVLAACYDTAELEHIAVMLGWSIGLAGAAALAAVGLLCWLVFGRGPSQRT